MEEEVIVKKNKPLWRRIIKICVIGFVILFFLLCSGVAILLTPKRLTPIAMRMADSFLMAEVRFDTLKVSFFQDFPYINLTVVNGNIRSRAFERLSFEQQKALPPNGDSLIRFEELSLSLHLKKLFQYQVDIRRIRLRNAHINAYMSPYGIANWEIWQSDTTMKENQEVEAFRLNLQRLIIRDGFRLDYLNDPDSLSASLHIERLFIRGEIVDQWKDIQIETLSASGILMDGHSESQKACFHSSIDSLRIVYSQEERYSLFVQSSNTITMDTIRYAESLPIDITGEIGFSLYRLDSLFFKDFNLTAAKMPIQLNGSLVFDAPKPRVRLDCSLDSLSLSGIIALLPPSLVPKLNEIETDINAKIHANINYPAYTLDIKTSGGRLSYPSQNAYIQTLALDATYSYRPDKPKLSGIDIRQCDIEASGIVLHAKGYVQNPSGDPDIDLTVLGNIILDTLYRILPFPSNVTARGAIHIDATAKCLWSELLQGDLHTTALRGRVDAERLLLRLPKDSIMMMARNAHLSFGANLNQRDSLIEQGIQILRLSFRADSANVRYKQQFRMAMGNTRLSARTAASALDGDTTKIHPLTGSLETTYLSLLTTDSTAVTLEAGACTFSVLPAPHDSSIPVVTTQLHAHAFKLGDKVNRYALDKPKISLQATHLRSNMEANQRREIRLDSLQALYPSIPRDSLNAFSRQLRLTERATDSFSSHDIDMEMTTDNKRLLRQWQLEGTIQADGGALFTPYFPLPVILGSTDIEINTDEFHLMQTEIQAGNSQIECTGKISNLRQVLLGRGNLNVYGYVRSDTLDVNELMQAANAGAFYASSGIIVKELEEVNPLIIIPANLTLDLKLFSAHTRYANEYLYDLSGSLTSRNRSLQINDLEASSSAGTFKMSALYATKSKNDITVGFDLEMNKVLINRLIALIPSIDTLAPMLRSFQGMVDCQISATAAMDTLMNILLPTLKAACHIQGENMVLLDGETFAEISKMLYFKNKNRNLIDHIAVDFLIHDSQIEVFPFIMEMDRYRTAVSGTHRFDMSFNYHISVLHSPIPFKLGVDVSGTLDNLRYRIVRCKYRNVNIPSYVELINTTRISLLQAIKAFDPAAALQTVERTVQAARIEEEEEVFDLDI